MGRVSPQNVYISLIRMQYKKNITEFLNVISSDSRQLESSQLRAGNLRLHFIYPSRNFHLALHVAIVARFVSIVFLCFCLFYLFRFFLQIIKFYCRQRQFVCAYYIFVYVTHFIKIKWIFCQLIFCSN